jgi:hypothetical protein
MSNKFCQTYTFWENLIKVAYANGDPKVKIKLLN